MRYTTQIPDTTRLYPLFVESGWNEKLRLSPRDLERAAQNSYVAISVYENEELLGFGRVISDGVVYATIHDVVVMPRWRRQGVGSNIIRRLLAICQDHAIHSIHLFANKGAEDFYRSLGFTSRAADSPGMVYEKR